MCILIVLVPSTEIYYQVAICFSDVHLNIDIPHIYQYNKIVLNENLL